MAPEAGTERLREVTRKVISDEQLFAACDLLRRVRHPQPQVLLHDRPAHGDTRGRRRHPGPGRAHARAAPGAGAGRPPVRQAHAVGVLVRAEAVDAVSVGGVRRRPEPRGQARDHQARGAAALGPRRAREPAGGGTPGPPRPRRPPTRGLHRDGGRSRRRLAPRAQGMGRRSRVLHAPSATCRETFPWDHLDVGVRKTGLLREWQRAGLGEPAAV